MNKLSSNRQTVRTQVGKFLSLSIIATATAMLCACATTSNQSTTTNDIPKPNKPGPKRLFNIPKNHPSIRLLQEAMLNPINKIVDPLGNNFIVFDDLNKLHNAIISNKNLTNPETIKIKTIADKTKQLTETVFAIQNKDGTSKQIFVPMVFDDDDQFNPTGGYYRLVISNGNVTPTFWGDNALLLDEFPPAGTVTYKGLAIGSNKTKNDFDIGSITMEVTFGNNKKIKGTITREDGQEIKLEETTFNNPRNPHKYTGTAKANINNVDKTGTYEGHIYGYYSDSNKSATGTIGKVKFSNDEKYLSSGFGARRVGQTTKNTP